MEPNAIFEDLMMSLLMLDAYMIMFGVTLSVLVDKDDKLWVFFGKMIISVLICAVVFPVIMVQLLGDKIKENNKSGYKKRWEWLYKIFWKGKYEFTY